MWLNVGTAHHKNAKCNNAHTEQRVKNLTCIISYLRERFLNFYPRKLIAEQNIENNERQARDDRVS